MQQVAVKSSVSLLEDVEYSIRRSSVNLMWNNTLLTPRNQEFMADLYVLMSCIWYDTSLSPELLNQRWISFLMNEDVDQVISLLKDVDFELISQHHSVASFKHWLRGIAGQNGCQILAPIMENLLVFLRQGTGLPRIRTCLRFITRANFPDPLGLEEEAFSNWKEVCLRPWVEQDTSREERIISTIFPRRLSPIQVDDFRPRFGPGASAGLEDSCILQKYLNFSTDSLLNYVGNKVGFAPCEMPRCKDGLSRVHHVHFVPKQLDKLRVVSMEPCSLMFYQLGIQKWMNDLMSHSRWNKSIDLFDADKNRYLAWLGSITGEYATIDLSSASDSVRLDLVKKLFNNTCLREALLGTRSRRALYDGVEYSPTYFAPMGSGTCFQVECAVFASIVEGVMCHNRDRRAWRVYGDDIICPSDRAEEVIDRLTLLGFEVNVDKSFYSTKPGFRESCGGDYYLGENVRPVYVSRRFTGLHADPRHPSTIACLIDTANSLYDYKYARLRTIKSLLKVKPGILFDDSGEKGLFSIQPSNYHLQSRFNEDLQCYQYRHGNLQCRVADTPEEYEDIRLFETLRAMEHSSPLTERMPVAIGPTTTQKWKPTWGSPAPGWDFDSAGVS